MGRKIDLTGQRFGRLTVIGFASRDKKYGHAKWLCQCDCGKITDVDSSNLRRGQQSCGCLSRENLLASVTKHGKRHTRLYGIWVGMRQRCRDKNNKSYKRYGGRGITVCDEWNKDFTVFEKWAIENGYADNLSIDRIDNNGNYEPSNCRWADDFTQNNNKRDNVLITVGNDTYTATEWARLSGLKPSTIHNRLFIGWKPEDAVMRKRRNYGCKNHS